MVFGSFLALPKKFLKGFKVYLRMVLEGSSDLSKNIF
jgi:hypothetical protein